MSERKVLNKYYPPEFDPTKIPKLKGPKNRTYTIRIMAPFNMRCNTCGEYIYKGKKFNSRKETVEDETYLGLYIFRFYIKCPRCVAEIAFKTDPENTDYALEAGATRNFEALRTAEALAKKEVEDKEAEDASNPMKVLENRTKASQREMDMLETLGELKELNSRHAKVDHEQVIKLHTAYEAQLRKLQDEEDEEFIKSVFGKDGNMPIKRLNDEEESDPLPIKKTKTDNPTSILTKETEEVETVKKEPWQKSVGGLSSARSKLGLLVKKKQPSQTLENKTNGTVTTSNAVKSNVTTSKTATNGTVAPSGLGLLGNYSDSESDGSS